MIPRPPTSRLRHLVDRRLADTITRIELAELEEALRDPAALDYYLRTTEIEAALRHLHADNQPQLVEPASLPVAQPPSDHRLLLASAAALVVLLAAGAIAFALRSNDAFVRIPDTVSRPTTAAAKVVRQIGSPGDLPDTIRTGDHLTIGPGLVEIAFHTGAIVLLEGPARFSVTTPSTTRLDSGRCVVRVPYSGPALQVVTPHGTVSGIQAEFAVDVPETGESVNVGVFHGRAHLSGASGNRRVAIAPRHALQHSGGDEFRSIAFPFESFHRRFPSNELAWSAPPDSFDPTTIHHDLTGLVWGAGTYRIYFRWMHGSDALIIQSAELLLDGNPITADVHDAITGDHHHTRDNSYLVVIPEGAYQKGTWSLRTTVHTNPRKVEHVQLPEDALSNRQEILHADDPRLRAARERIFRTLTTDPDSHGVLLIDRGPAATTADFCGDWNYTYNGRHFRRTFLPGGTARFTDDGIAQNNFDRSTWTAEDGILTLTIRDPQSGAFQCIERHLLSNQNTLIFLDRPYRNASRQENE